MSAETRNNILVLLNFAGDNDLPHMIRFGTHDDNVLYTSADKVISRFACQFNYNLSPMINAFNAFFVYLLVNVITSYLSDCLTLTILRFCV